MRKKTYSKNWFISVAFQNTYPATTINTSTRPVSLDAEYSGSIALSVAKKPRSGPSQTSCCRCRSSYKHDTSWEVLRWAVEMQPPLLHAGSWAKEMQVLNSNQSILRVSWWSSWSADHARIDSLCDFNPCVRTYLQFAAFPPKLFPHKVSNTLMLSHLFQYDSAEQDTLDLSTVVYPLT